MPRRIGPPNPGWFCVSFLVVVAGCGSEDGGSDGPPIEEIPGVQVRFDLSGVWNGKESFFHFPYPSDLRRTQDGRPDLTGFPDPHGSEILGAMLKVAGQRRGFPTMPVAHFGLTDALQARVQSDVIPARPDSPVLLLDIGDGTLYPTVAHTLPADSYVPQHTLSVAPQPGVVLPAGRTFAFVLLRGLDDGQGRPLGVPLAFNQLRHGELPDGARAREAAELYKALWPALDAARVDGEAVAGATVFTTGDVVGELAKMTAAVVKQHRLEITSLELDRDGDHTDYCELEGLITYPQFQRGEPPFDTEGLFELDGSGVPSKQREEGARVVITLPKQKMPAAGYPVMIYLHGTAGVPAQLVDRPWVGQGPASVVAPLGVAGAASSLPLNPERLPGGTKFAYLNLVNLPAFRDTFRQGALETALFLEALGDLTIPASTLQGCTGPELPAGASGFKLSVERVAVMGQSMGAAYANLAGAIIREVGAVVPTGSGGYYPFYMFRTSAIPGSAIGPLLGIYGQADFTHPVIHVLLLAWEAADPMVYAGRLSRRPLAGHPARHIYQPVGKNDSYFNEEVFDAMAVAYGTQQAGKELWPSMQKALSYHPDLDGIASYPASENVPSRTGGRYTGVVAQYARPNDNDGHQVAFALDEVKHQYRCFVSSYLETGKAVVPAPAALTAPCN
jgi:hypothetical protein